MASSTSRASRVKPVKPRTAGGALGGIIGAVAMSVVAGVLVTAAITPIVAVSGAAASTAIDMFDRLPNHLNPGQLAQPSTIYAKNSKDKWVEVATFYDQDREMVGWGQISEYVKDAAVAEEDPRFFTHGGVDVLATARAALQNIAGSGFSGASTITMQYVRNVLIQDAMSLTDEEERDAAYEDAMRQDIDRKLKEMRYALSVEKQYSKDEILLGYLNIALFGRQVYGIESAAHYYYDKKAKDLTLAESASLVAIVNNPSLYQIDVEENIPANKERRDKILQSMLDHGRISQAEYDEAVATEIEPDITPRVQGCAIAETKRGLGHFCDYVQRYIKHDANFGETPEEREFNFSRGGYKIYTTIDLEIQKAGREAMNATVPANLDGIDVGAASVSTEVGTGRVLGMVQNRAYSNDPDVLESNDDLTSINYNTDFEHGGSTGFQVGSTFKAITLAEWIRTGHSVNDRVNVDGRTVQENSFRASCLSDGVYGFGSFTFTNDNMGTRGNQTVQTAMDQSVNGGLVSMQQQMDLCDTFKMAEDLGLKRASDLPPDPNDESRPFVPTLNGDFRDLSMVPSNVYGGIDEIAPITMSLAYGAFASDGTVCTPVPIDRIEGPDDEPVAFTGADCRQAIDPEVAAGVAYSLERVVTGGLATHARSNIGVPHLAKTGTTDDVVDNWTVGASSKVSTATWVGNAGPVKLWDGTWGRVSTQGYGGLMYADQTIWPAMMNAADAKYGGDPFPEPDTAATRTTMVDIPNLAGRSYDEAEQALQQLGFTASDGGEVDGSEPKGTVARTDPAGSAPMGSAVRIFRSNGEASEVPGGLVGQTGSSAEGELASAGFSSVRFSCAGGNGSPRPDTHEVRSVKPGEGRTANTSDRVTLTLDCR